MLHFLSSSPRFRRAAALFAACAFAIPLALAAETLRHEEAGVQIEVPSDWTKDGDSDSLAVTDPSEEVALILLVTDAEEAEDALNELDATLSEIVSEASLEEPAEVELNGMPAIIADGTGQVEGVAVELGVAVIKTPKAKALILIGVVEASVAAKHQPAIDRIIGSIQPL